MTPGSSGKLLIVIGEHEFDQYELRELLVSARDCEIAFCMSEMDITLATTRRRPNALMIGADWQSDRLAAVLRQMDPEPGCRFPVYLFGRASGIALHNPGHLEIHRFSGALPDDAVLADLCNVRAPEPALPADELLESTAVRPPQPADMHALTRFLGGIAHDFNNLLASIMGEVQLAQSRCHEERVTTHLGRANEACARMAGEIRKLLIFQESVAEKRGMVDCAAVMRDARGFIPEMLGPDVEVETVESPEPLWVEGTVSGVRQVLLNLTAYACQQVTHARGVRVVARRAEGAVIPAVADTRPATQPVALIEIVVRGEYQNGSQKAAAFQPIFAQPGRDAGVGLAIVWRLVHDFGGTVSVLNADPGSASFRVSLPLAHPAIEAPAAYLKSLRGSERVLILSTDRTGVEALSRALREQGYLVAVESSPSTLPNLASATGDVPQCILLDTACEGIDPEEAHATIRANLPRVPLLLASPDFTKLARPPYSEDGLACLVHRPFDVKEVLSTLRALMVDRSFVREEILAQRD